jgi:hypothetical protein
LHRRVRERNPSPFSFLINLGEKEYLVGASPEVKSHTKSPTKRRTHLEVRVYIYRAGEPFWGASPPVTCVHALKKSQCVWREQENQNFTRRWRADDAMWAVLREQMFVRTNGRRVETCPISGTITRGETPIEDAANIKVGRHPRNRCAMIPQIDANIPSIGAMIPQIDANIPSIGAMIPQIDANIPSIGSMTPTIDAFSH